MSQSKKPYIFVVGNEKGGAGKTTCSIHLIVGLLDKGYKVSSIDADARQASLSSYLQNRLTFNRNNPDNKVLMPTHYHLQESTHENMTAKDAQERELFESILAKASEESDYIVIDTPGSYTNFSRIAHSYADKVITPINDSFIDVDVMAKVDNDGLDVSKPSIYSQMLWEQKMERASRDRGSIEWVVVRNRLSSLDARNKRNVAEVLEKLSKRIAFKIIPGFSERVIFRELFPSGLTLLDLSKSLRGKAMNLSHVAARQELRDFIDALGIEQN